MKFRDLTTIKVGGEIQNYFEVIVDEDVADDLRRIFSQFPSSLVIGGGSNILPNDGEIDRAVIKLIQKQDSLHFNLGFSSAVKLSDIVRLANIPELEGIPGTLGGAVFGNAGAYGVEISDYVRKVEAFDRKNGELVSLSKDECDFSYRNSIFKETASENNGNSQYVILSVELECFPKNSIGDFCESVHNLNMDRNNEILDKRAEKGMLEFDLENPDFDRISCGSFFKNPIVDKFIILNNEELFRGIPQFPTNDRYKTKLSAAALIESSGFYKGYHLPGRSVQISTKHALAITNPRPHENSRKEIDELVQLIKENVYSKFKIKLEEEVVVL